MPVTFFFGETDFLESRDVALLTVRCCNLVFIDIWLQDHFSFFIIKLLGVRVLFKEN